MWRQAIQAVQQGSPRLLCRVGLKRKNKHKSSRSDFLSTLNAFSNLRFGPILHMQFGSSLPPPVENLCAFYVKNCGSNTTTVASSPIPTLGKVCMETGDLNPTCKHTTKWRASSSVERSIQIVVLCRISTKNQQNGRTGKNSAASQQLEFKGTREET